MPKSNTFTEPQYPAGLPRIRVTIAMRDAIISIAKREKRSIGDIQREAIALYLSNRETAKPA